MKKTMYISGLLGTLFACVARSSLTARTYHDRKKTEKREAEIAAALTDAPEKKAEMMMVSPETKEAMLLMHDPEFLRLKAMYSLTKETGYIWQIVPKMEPTERAVTYAHPFGEQEETAA